MRAGESRALMMGLEQDNQLPPGILQAVGEEMTGYRADNPLLPAHVARDPDRANEHQQMAARMGEKLAEFGGVVPLAIDAYYRGDKATRASLQGAGFPAEASERVYKTLARAPKYGGQDWSAGQGAEALAQVMGKPARDYSGLANAPIPKPIAKPRLQQRQDGRWTTGDTFFDAMMYIESGNRSHDAHGNIITSPTGAKGLYQFTKGTGATYGLVGKGYDRRGDPEANFIGAQRLAADNARALSKAGIPVTPTTLYLAHQQGAGGAVAIWNAAKSGKEVPADIRSNMNHNNGRGKTAAQFIQFVDAKVQDAVNKARAGGARDGAYMGANVDVPELPAFAAHAEAPGEGAERDYGAGLPRGLRNNYAPQEDAGADVGWGSPHRPDSGAEPPTPTMPGDLTAQLNNPVLGQSAKTAGEQSADQWQDADSTQANLTTGIDWLSKLDDAFRAEPEQAAPVTLQNIIAGMVARATGANRT